MAESDEEELRKLRHLAQTLERSIFPSSRGRSDEAALEPPTRISSQQDADKENDFKISNLLATSPPPQPTAIGSAGEPAPLVMPNAMPKSVHERLYEQSKPKPCPPMPRKEPPKKKMTVWDRQVAQKRRDLYIDAECRRREQKERQQEKQRRIEEESSRSKMAPHSEELAKKRKVKVLREVFRLHSLPCNDDCDVEAGDCRAEGKLSYDGLTNVFSAMGFFSNKTQAGQTKLVDKAWSTMLAAATASTKTYVYFNDFTRVMLGMLNGKKALPVPMQPPAMMAAGTADLAGSLENGRSSSVGRYRSRSYDVGSIGRASRRSLSAGGGTVQVDGLLEDLNINTLAPLQGSQRQQVICQQLAEARKCAASAAEPQCTFNPAINNNSRRLTRGQDTGTPRYMTLGSEVLKKELRLKEAAKNKAEAELKECTFHPTINKSSARRTPDATLTAPTKSSQQRQAAEERITAAEELELQECTFEPKTNPNYRRVKDQPLPNGYFESIKRLRERRSESKKFEDQLREQRYSERLSTAPKPTVVKPFNLRSEKKERSRPLLFLDVQLPRGRKGRIGIHEGDSAEALARSFATTYQLDSAMEAKLVKVLQQNMDVLLPELLEERRRQRGEPLASRSPDRIATDFATAAEKVEQLALAELEAEISAAAEAVRVNGPAVSFKPGDLLAGDAELAEICHGAWGGDEFLEEAMKAAERESAAGAFHPTSVFSDTVVNALAPPPKSSIPPPQPPPAPATSGSGELQSPPPPPVPYYTDPHADTINALFQEIQAMEQQYGIA